MTVASTINRVSVVGNNTAGQAIPFTFPILEQTELTVIKRLIADGVETVLSLTTDFTVVINSDDSGGTVTLVSAIPSTYHIHVIRQTDKEQALDLTHGGAFNGENIEDALDRLSRLAIDHSDKLDRCLQEPKTDTTAGMVIPNRIERAESYLYFDVNGNASAVNAFEPGTLAVSTFAETVLDDTSASAMLTTLGFTSMAKTLLAISSNAAFLTELGITAFAQDLLADTTAAETRATLDVLGVADIVTDDDEVVCYDGEVVTYS